MCVLVPTVTNNITHNSGTAQHCFHKLNSIEFSQYELCNTIKLNDHVFKWWRLTKCIIIRL